MTVLIVTWAECDHVPPVQAELERRGKKVVRLDLAEFPHRASLTQQDGLAILERGSEVVELDKVESVWLRRTMRPSVEGLADAAFAAQEWWGMLVGLGQCLGQARWSNPLRTYYDQDGGLGKVRQLQAAKAVGLEVPRTCATSNPERARAFVAEVGDAVYKPFSPNVQVVEGQKRILWCTPVTEHVDFATVALAPGIFQENVKKRCELRVTVFGERVFACEIDSSTSPQDYRQRWKALPRKRHALPSDVEQKLLAMHRELDLTVGTSDWMVTPDGRYVFCEVNPMGTWAWTSDVFEPEAMDSAMADLLAPGG